MRTLHASQITDAVEKLAAEKAYHIPEEILRGFDWALDNEESESGMEIIKQLKENASIAAKGVVPYCQDTGTAVFFVEVGQLLSIEGSLDEAIQEGVRKAYVGSYLRKSIYRDPLRRVNTGDNTPAVIHYSVVPGDRLRIVFGAKGGGSENMSRLVMLKPSDGLEGVKDFVVQTVSLGGANACPPLVLGVGIGGNFEKCAILAKRAAIRSLEERNKDPFYAQLEEDLKSRCNDLGIGPMGLGGTVTVLAVNIEVAPCHLVALPVAVNVNCHAARHGEITL